MKNMEKKSDLLQKRREKIEELKTNKINLFPNGFVVSHTVRDIQTVVEEDPDSLTENGPELVLSHAGP